MTDMGRTERADVILPARDYDDAAEIHGRPRIPAPFERQAKKQRLLDLAKQRLQERPNA